MTTDKDRFDEWLQEASASYNAPPPAAEIPRDAMWQRVVAARREQATPVRRVTRSPWMLALAASLLLAVGIGIGRMTESETGERITGVTLNDSATATAYRVAAARHLTSAEAFVTAVRLQQGAAGDTGIRRWARELLTDTRLLMDSPAGNDASRRALFEDLELLLVQIMQLEESRTSDTDERLLDLKDHDQLLTRLRATVPSGPPART
jgi:hypothetical protein